LIGRDVDPRPADGSHSDSRLTDARRVADVVLAGLGLLVLSPLLFGVALLILIRSGRPVMHVATRVGLGGRPFPLYKFRTMVTGAAGAGPAVTVKGDPRVTPLGRILRRYKLDELPQLVNVVKGEMSLVGPRPEDPTYVRLYTPAQRQILSIKPGITSVASLRYRSEEDLLHGPEWEKRYIYEIMPTKVRMEIDHACTRSLPGDLVLVLSTVIRLARRQTHIDGVD